MNNPTILYLSRKDVDSLGLSMSEVIRAVEDVFVEKGNGRVEMPPKPGIHPVLSENSTMHIFRPPHGNSNAGFHPSACGI